MSSHVASDEVTAEHEGSTVPETPHKPETQLEELEQQNTPTFSLLPAIKLELVEMTKLSLPIVISLLCGTGMGFVDMLFIGKLGDSKYLAGASLANAFVYCLLYLPIGLVAAQDTLVSQAYGAKNFRVVRVVLCRSIFIAMCICIPISLLFGFSDPIYKLFSEDAQVSANAALFTYLLLPGLIPFVLYRIFSSFLVSQSAVYYPMAIGIAANILNIFLNFALVYGIGYVALGYIGAPIATSIARVSLMVMAVAAIWWRSRKPATDGSENQKVSTVTMIKDTMQWSGLKEFIILAIPSILMLCFEVWGFNGNALIVARIGEKEQSAHAIVSHLIVVSFMLPLAVSVATSVRIGQRLGARDAAGAKFVCWFGIALGIGLTFINSAIMLATKGVIAKLFIEGDEDVRVLAESIVPLAALFTTSDGAQAVMSGVLRGLGRQNIGAAAGFIAYYVIGIPLSLVFGFYFDMGLWGVWLGMTLGMFVVSFVMMPYLYFAVDWNTECDKAAQRIKAQDVHQHAEEIEVTELKQQDKLDMPESGAELEEI